MKKIFMVMLLSIMVLAGCGAKADTGPVELRISWWGGDPRHTATLNAIAVYQEQNPDITIKAEYTGFNGHQEKLTTQIAGGTEPDIMQLNWNWVPTFSPDGSGFQDLNSFKDIIELKNFSAEDLEFGTVNGKLNAIPISTAGRVLFVNKNTYDKFGAKIPETWDDLFAAAEKFDEGYYPLDLEQNVAFSLIVTYMEQQTGKAFVSEDNKVGLTEAELATGFKFYQSLVDKGVSPSIEERSGQGGKVELFEMPNYFAGKYAGVYEWSSSAAKYSKPLKEQGQDLVLAGVPKGANDKATGIIAKPAQLWGISKSTKHPEEAAKLLNFLLNDEAAAKELGLERGIPNSAAALKVLETEDKLKGLEVEGTEYVKANVDMAGSPYFDDAQLLTVYRATVEKFGYGQITAEQAAAEIHKAVTDKLASV